MESISIVETIGKIFHDNDSDMEHGRILLIKRVHWYFSWSLRSFAVYWDGLWDLDLLGIYMENHETIDGIEGSYPFAGSYNQIFLAAGLLSGVPVVIALLLRK